MSQRLATPSPAVVRALCCAMAATAGATAGASAHAEAKRSYNLPRGDAATTLNQFGGASDRPIVFMMDKVRGEKTNAVAGEFSPAEALARMLAGTALIARQDNATGAFVVSRAVRSDSADPPSPKPKPQTQAAPKPVKSKTLIALLTGWLSLSVANPEIRSADGGGSASGVIRGQVFNPATQQYVRNAEIQIEGTNVVTYTGADGSYVLANVPEGEIKVSVNYTGYEPHVATVRVGAGESVTRNFELVGRGYQNTGQPAQGEGGVVRLNEFVVSTEREGNAKAIMEQRASLNTKTVVASDNFGDITGGHVGEFIKYLPGVVMDTDDYGDPWGARIGGLDPKYAGVTIDGMRMASGGNASGLNSTARQFDFNLISIAGIESIEVNKTSTASMDGDSPAGAINLRSKNAFERKGREITAQLSLTGNTYEMSLRKTPGPNNESKTYKMLPGINLSYANVFGERMGVQLSLGSSSVYTTRNDLTTGFNYSLPARGPLITSLTFQEAPKVTERSTLGANLDFKLMTGLVFSIGTSGSYVHSQNGNFSFRFLANPAQVDASSTLTKVVALPVANVNTRIETFGQQNDQFYNTVTHISKLEYQRGDLNVTAAGSYARSRTHLEDLNSGLFQAVNMRLTRISWMAERTSPRSTDWNLTQLSGRPWNDIGNFGRDDPFPNQINANPRSSQNQIFTGKLDVKKTLNLGLPVVLQSGWKTRLTTYDKKGLNFRLTYVGPTGNQLDRAAAFLPETLYKVDTQQGGNFATLGLPSVNRYGMYDLWVAHPEYFQTDPTANILDEITGGASSIKEQVDSGYAEATTKWDRLRLNAGLRHERTRTVARTIDVLPAAAVRAAGFTPGTVEFVRYQYRNGERSKKYGGYDNWFLSGGAKYALTKELVLHLSGSQSIGRPDYDQLAGGIVVNDTQQTVSVPNSELKPETSNKYFASLQYYLEPSGVLGVSAYQLDIRNMGAARSTITAEAAGYGDDPEYTGYTFLQTVNLDGTRKIKGFEIEYSQQLVFLPGVWRGLSVFGSMTRIQSDTRVIAMVPKAANGGIRFSNHRFNVQVRSTWQAPSAVSFSAVQDIWWYERLTFDFSGGYRLNQTYELTVSGRNINNAPKRSYSNEPDLLVRKILMGAVWTVGIRGRF